VPRTGVVEKVRTKEEGKILTLSGDVELELHRTSCVGLEDQLRVTKRSGRLRVDAPGFVGWAVKDLKVQRDRLRIEF